MSWRSLLFTVLAVAVFALGAVIGHANTAPIQFDYLLGIYQGSLIVVLLGVFLCGVVLSLAVSALRVLSLRAEIRGLRRHLKDAEGELRTLRNLPIPSTTSPRSGNSTAG